MTRTWKAPVRFAFVSRFLSFRQKDDLMKPGAKNIQTWPGKLKVYLSCFILYNHPFVCMISKIIDAMARGVLMPNAYAIKFTKRRYDFTNSASLLERGCWRQVFFQPVPVDCLEVKRISARQLRLLRLRLGRNVEKLGNLGRHGNI